MVAGSSERWRDLTLVYSSPSEKGSATMCTRREKNACGHYLHGFEDRRPFSFLFFFPPSSSETSNNSRVAIYSSCLLFLYLAYVVINTLIKIRYFENLCTRMKKKKKYVEETIENWIGFRFMWLINWQILFGGNYAIGE